MDKESNELTRVRDENESPDAVATAAGATGVSSARSDNAPNNETETASATDETSEEPEQIRADIEQTRSKMGETIDAIQEKLSFSNIAEQVKDTVSDHISSAVETARDAVYDATIGKAGSFMQNIGKSIGDASESVGSAFGETGTSVVRVARRNPLPLALIGLGVGMLLMQRSSSRKRSVGYRYDNESDRYAGDRGRNRGGGSRQSLLGRAGETASSVAGSAYSGVTGAASSAYSGVTSAAGTAVSGVGTAASAAYQGVGSVAGSAYEQAGNLGTHVRRYAGQAQNQYEYHIEENPLAVGAVALALGAAVGFAIPSTEYEGGLMGEYRENLMQKAQDAARGAFDKVSQVASEVSSKVQDVASEVAAKVQDTAGEVGGSVQKAAGDVGGIVQQAAGASTETTASAAAEKKNMDEGIHPV